MAAALVGRRVELETIEAFLDGLDADARSLVVEGEPGIGKTTLWREAERLATERGATVLSCRPAEAELRLSFTALADLVAPIADELLPALPTPQRRALEVALLRDPGGDARVEQRAVGTALASVLDAAARRRPPVVVLIDDAQWLDRSSAAALDFALGRLRRDRVGVLAFRRPPAKDRPSFLPRDAETIRLSPLSVAATHELLKSRLGRSLPRPLLVRVHETAGGVPFYALEIAREVLANGARLARDVHLPVPDDLAELVVRRVRRLPAATRDALLLAAAAPEPTVAKLSRAAGADAAAALEPAEEADVVAVGDGLVRFTHPLYAAAVYSSATIPTRRAAHRRLAAVASGEERALHLAAAATGPAQDVAAALEEAAGRAQARGASADAAALFADAARLTPADDPASRGRRALAAAETAFDSGDTPAARSTLRQILDELPPGPHRARALLQMALVHYYDDGPVPAKETCLRALDEAGDDTRLRAEIHLRLSLVSDDDITLSRRSSRVARELVEADAGAPDDLVAAALIEDAYIGFLSGEGMATEQVERAAALIPPLGRSWPRQRANAALSMWLKYTDQLDRARAALVATIERRREEGDDYEASMTMLHLAEVDCLLGDFAGAREHADAGGALIEQAGNALEGAFASFAHAFVAAHAGEEDAARAAAVQGLAIADDAGDTWIATLNLSLLGFVELAVGDARAADRWLTRAAANVEAMGLPEPARFRFQGDHVEALVALGELERADEQLEALRRRAAVAPRPWLLCVTARAEALLAAARGDLDAADAALERALAAHDRLGVPFELARTLLARGRVQRRRKQRKAARESLRTALELFDSLPAPRWAEQARAELDRTHVREAPHTLSPTEEQVARLAADGLKNREIAKRLFMSPKTVEANLARVYRKLGISSRAELGAVMGSAAGTP